MIGFVMAELALWTASFVYHYWPRDPKQPPPGAVGGVPRTDEGAPLPLIYGRCRVRAPVLAWIGNWRVNLSSSNSAGYQADMLFIVGVPFYGGGATIQQIFAGDFRLFLIPTPPGEAAPNVGVTAAGARPGKSMFTSSNAATVYGGEDGNGGIRGDIEFFDGRPDQLLSDYVNDHDIDNNLTILQTRQTLAKWVNDEHIADPAHVDETLMPGYRNQSMCLLWQWSIGRIPNFTSYSFEVTSLSTGTAADLGSSLPNDADPAAVIYDLLTSPWGKLGFPASKVDRDSFQAASATLLGEGHGYSRAIEQADDATTIIGDVLRQADAMLYEEPTTGQLVLKLVRNDYGDPALLPRINPDNARPADADWYQVQGWSETLNQVRLTFTDRQNNYADGLAVAQNAANASSQDSRGLRSTDLKFVGCCTRELAEKLAARELAAVSHPLVTATVIVNRSFHTARPGSVYALTWPELGIQNMVMRVVRADLGQLHKGEITLDLIRDIFDVSLGAFPVPA
jgi:hypothetical protein